MKKTRLRPISKKRERELTDEIDARRQLCDRAGGWFVTDGKQSRCIGGMCEDCGEAPDWRGLSPHEEPFRSHGGRVSLKDSKMLCGKCHSTHHGVREV